MLWAEFGVSTNCLGILFQQKIGSGEVDPLRWMWHKWQFSGIPMFASNTASSHLRPLKREGMEETTPDGDKHFPCNTILFLLLIFLTHNTILPWVEISKHNLALDGNLKSVWIANLERKQHNFAVNMKISKSKAKLPQILIQPTQVIWGNWRYLTIYV